jgi:hypothetical protein
VGWQHWPLQLDPSQPLALTVSLVQVSDLQFAPSCHVGFLRNTKHMIGPARNATCMSMLVPLTHCTQLIPSLNVIRDISTILCNTRGSSPRSLEPATDAFLSQTAHISSRKNLDYISPSRSGICPCWEPDSCSSTLSIPVIPYKPVVHCCGQ